MTSYDKAERRLSALQRIALVSTIAFYSMVIFAGLRLIIALEHKIGTCNNGTTSEQLNQG